MRDGPVMRKGLRPGGWAWLGLVGSVVATDAYLIRRRKKAVEAGVVDPERWATMSVVFGDLLSDKWTRVPVVIVWASLTLHLFAVLIPAPIRERLGHFDAIGALARAIERAV
jgi:hypothetical protein